MIRLDTNALRKLNPMLYHGIYSRGRMAALRHESKQDCPWNREGDFNLLAREVWSEGFELGRALLSSRGPRKRVDE